MWQYHRNAELFPANTQHRERGADRRDGKLGNDGAYDQQHPDYRGLSGDVHLRVSAGGEYELHDFGHLYSQVAAIEPAL